MYTNKIIHFIEKVKPTQAINTMLTKELQLFTRAYTRETCNNFLIFK